MSTVINDIDPTEVRSIIINRKGVAILDAKSDELYVLWKEGVATANKPAAPGLPVVPKIPETYAIFRDLIEQQYGVRLSLFSVSNIAAQVTADMNELKKNSSNEQGPPVTGSDTNNSQEPNNSSSPPPSETSEAKSD